MNWFLSETDWSSKAKKLIKTKEFKHISEFINTDLTNKLYGDILVNSVSRLETYEKCACMHFLQYGLGTIGNPAEPNVLSNRFRKGYIKNNADTSDIIFTDNPVLNKIRRKSNYNFSSKTISTFQATFFKPKHSGNGFIGIYIDSIGQIAGNIADLVLYAESFDHIESKELEKMFQSLVIKDFK